MAAALRVISVLVLFSCFLAFVWSKDTLYLTHIPQCVSFKEDAGSIPSAEFSDIVSALLGFTPSKDLTWSGLGQGNLFQRPSANVLVTVDSVSGSKIQPSFTSSRQYEATGNDAVHMDSARASVSKAYGHDAGIYIDLSIDSKDIKLPKKYQPVFSNLPTTLKGVFKSLQGDDSVLNDFHQGSLNLTKDSDAILLGELQLLKDIITKMTSNKALLQDGVPDLFSFTVSGLRAVQTEYGVDSKQADDASRLVSEFLNKFSTDFAALYKNNALVEVLLSENAPNSQRISRSILQATTAPPTPSPIPTPETINIVGPVDPNFAVMFNIFLWLMVVLVVTVFAVAYNMWYMDPGDTIIYRMTSQRMKID